MDCFGDGGLGAVSVSVSATASLAAAVTTDQEKWYGSGILKQEISGANAEGDLRGLKVAKTAALHDFSAPKATQRTSLLRSNSYIDGHGQQMLCFSSPNSQSMTFPFCHSSSNAYTKNAAYGSGGLNGGSMQGSKGLFTPSQWMELEHQALIYKYITAKVPIPSSLLIPIRKALDSAGFSSFFGLKPSSYGWSALHLGFSNGTDPEPGRCRRTDGKKWRCSKDAMADHKYCERHMNRGRHRSRKLVEGQAGHPVSGTTNSKTKVTPPTASAAPAAGVPVGGASNSLGLAICQQLNNTQSGPSQPSASGPVNRSFLDKENLGRSLQDITGLSMISPAVGLKGNQYSIPRQQEAYHGSSGGEFGQVCSDSLLNPLDKSSSLVGCGGYGTSEDRKDIKSKSHNGLHEFFAEWPNNSQSERLKPDVAMHTDRTRLSISIPMTASDFMSSTSSPTSERAGLSPSKCSRDLDAAKVGLVGSKANERNPREASWIPITWESSAGGPLGEVLHSTNNSSDESKTLSGLNLMTGWDGSQSLVSSPTGVLQKAAFVSLSNSSAGSSPRLENSKAHLR